MAHIRSRKHSKPVQPVLNPTILAAALATAPFAAHAQQADQAQTLPAVQVHSTAEVPYKAEQTASPKYTQPLLNTPQTITVIKQELMEQQRATTLTEALRNSPGVGVFTLGENGNTTTGDGVMMRGFDASNAIFVDNVRDTGSISRDMFSVEQVEVLKGPAGTDTGRGSPTGSINLVTKQAHKDNAFSASASYGSWDQKRVTADWNRLINSDNGTAFRLNLMKQDSGVPGRHEVKNDRSGVAAAFAYGLGSDTRVFFDYLHSEQNDVPDGGVPTIGLPGYSSPTQAASGSTPAIPARSYLTTAPKVDPRNFYGLAGDYNDVKADRFTLRVEHDFSPNVKLQNTTRYAKTTQDYLLTAFMGTAANLVTPNPADRSTWTLARSTPTIKDQTNEILTNQTYITAKLQTGSLKHTLFGGVEFTRETQDSDGYTTTGTLPAANLYNPNPNDGRGTWTRTRNGALDTSGETDTISAYLFDTIEFNEKWSLNGGVRVDHYSTDFGRGYQCGVGTRPVACPTGVSNGSFVRENLDSSDNLFNWKIAGIYKPTPNSSVYALYATSQQPPGGANFTLSSTASSADNPNFDPQKTKTIELGTKWDVLNKSLALTAAIYRTEIKNGIESDGGSPAQYFQTGEKRVQGLELGAVGAITPNWSLTAGYSLMKTEVTSGAQVTGAGQDNVLAYTPKHAFTAWTTYKLPKGFTIGGGARYTSSLTKGSDGAVGTPQKTDAYWVFDAMAGYVVNKNLDLQLNVYNLFDKEYVAAINKSGYRYTPGTSRAAMLTANLKF